MSREQLNNIRNFTIIAHIDHGKSTLADRIIEICGARKRNMRDQVLDSMDVERERGITIKKTPVQLTYVAKDKQEYILNLIDTPGHDDFKYEVEIALAACEGAILVVDLTQGVEAQTIANVYKALAKDLKIVIALNKIDLPSADPIAIKKQIEEIIGLPTDDAVMISAKNGFGVNDLLEKVIEKLPAPKIYEDKLKAMLIDSWYDKYLGVVLLLRVLSGKLSKSIKIRMMHANCCYTVDTVGIFTPKKLITNELTEGHVGFVSASIKDISHCKIGDTITNDEDPCQEPLAIFQNIKPVVFCSLYPSDASQFNVFKDSLNKLHLNDSSFTFEMETSNALGFGFRCGFLGLLHLEIIQERLEREFDLDLITTAPSVIYKVHLRTGEELNIHNPSDLPDPVKIESMEEPWVEATIISSQDYLGAILALCQEKRGRATDVSYSYNRVIVKYLLPLNEIIYDFYNNLQSISSGYASFDWQEHSYNKSELVNLKILVNDEPTDALSMIMHKSRAEQRGRELCSKLKELIPRELFVIKIQASIGSKIIARETISALRKDVTAKCYGGDVTRKRKLLEKQKEGKKRMRSIGNVDVPPSVFIAVLKNNKK